MILIGIFLVAFGAVIIWQASVPKEKRFVRAGRSSARPILSTRQCVRHGGILAIAGACVTTEAAGFHVGTAGVIVAVGLAVLVIVASTFVTDDSKA